MLRRVNDDPSIDPDQQMVGRCHACGTEVSCRREQCSIRNDPGFGPMVCVGCPKVVETVYSAEGDHPLTCGTRIYMKPAKQE